MVNFHQLCCISVVMESDHRGQLSPCYISVVMESDHCGQLSPCYITVVMESDHRGQLSPCYISVVIESDHCGQLSPAVLYQCCYWIKSSWATFTSCFVSVLLLNQIIADNFLPTILYQCCYWIRSLWATLGWATTRSGCRWQCGQFWPPPSSCPMTCATSGRSRGTCCWTGTSSPSTRTRWVSPAHKSLSVIVLFSFFFGRGTSHLKTGYVWDNGMKNNSFVFKYFLYFVFVFLI